MVEIFDNRIEITNPGTSLISSDRIIDARKSRNEKLADGMRTLNLCEERGSGFDKAFFEIEQAHLPSLEFITSPESVRVVLFGQKDFGKMSKMEKQRACFYHCVLCWFHHEPMSNSSLRERFSLAPDEYQSASAIISEAVKAKRIVAADPKQGNKYARYVPYWAAPHH